MRQVGGRAASSAGENRAQSVSLPQGYTLREMTPLDAPAVHALEMDLFPADAWPFHFFLDELAQPTRSYWVVEHRGHGADKIAGYAGIMCIPPVADVQTIAVAAEHEGRGLGRALMQHLHHQAHERGASEMMLEVRSDNPRAQRLYERLGYRHIHTRRGYYADGADALIMQRDLGTTTTIRSADGRTLHEHR